MVEERERRGWKNRHMHDNMPCREASAVKLAPDHTSKLDAVLVEARREERRREKRRKKKERREKRRKKEEAAAVLLCYTSARKRPWHHLFHQPALRERAER